MTATTGVVAPLDATMFNVMMKKYGGELLDAAGEKYGFDAEEAKSVLISNNNEPKNKVIELSIKMNTEDMNEWLRKRNNTKNKNKLDCLPQKELIILYNSFCCEVKRHIKMEMELDCNIGRIRNFPENISENIVIYNLRSLGYNCTWICKGDIMVDNIQGEVKCHFNGPSQFSPNKDKDGDILFYLEAENHINNGYFKLYKIDDYNKELKKIKINKDMSLEEQQDSGRRPRFNIKDVWRENFEDKLIWKGTIYDLLR